MQASSTALASNITGANVSINAGNNLVSVGTQFQATGVNATGNNSPGSTTQSAILTQLRGNVAIDSKVEPPEKYWL